MINHTELAADILEQAADALEVHGWTVGEFTDGQAMCAVGAIRYAAHGDADRKPRTKRYRLAIAAVSDLYGADDARSIGTEDRIIDWNDHLLFRDRETSNSEAAAEVIDGLRHAAKELRNSA